MFLTDGAQQDEEEWLDLFDGRSLDDWHVKIRGYELGDNYGNTFLIRDGVIATDYTSYQSFDQRFGHIFYKDPFSYYRLRVQYRFVGEQANDGPGWAWRNSGLMLHCQDPNTMALAQDFPISIEAQLLGGNGEDPRSTMNLCTPGTHVHLHDTLHTTHCITSQSDTYHGDQWVEVQALVLGDSLIVHYVEGEEVIRYTRPQVGGEVVNDFNPEAKVDGSLLKEGYISLQSESHPVEFRSVELLDLCGCMDKDASNYKSYFVKGDNSRCIYN